MRKLSVQDKVCILISWALMLLHSEAQQPYMIHNRNLTWEEARNHCQVCYKDLVTLTPSNIQSIAKNLTSAYWIGLRKNFFSNGNSSTYSTSNVTGNSTKPSTSIFWTRWANGDPLAFQNWYPGWPVFKSQFPRRDCCSCSCTCPAAATSFTRYNEFTTQSVTSVSGPRQGATQNVTNTIGFTSVTDQDVTNTSGFASVTDQDVTNMTNPTGQNITSYSSATTQRAPVFTTTVTPPPLPVEAECVRSPMLMPNVPDPDENYIEDSCVAMLSSGAWVEKHCTELLPFICYEDDFFGHVSVTDVTSSNAILTWMRGPGDISHYHLEVEGDRGQLLEENLHNLTRKLFNLTAGTRYTVKVFPIKCERYLKAQESSFYTTPNKVQNLNVISVTETSVSLGWNRSVGNQDFYETQVENRKIENTTEGIKVGDLTPGSLYTFTIFAGVNDTNKTKSEGSTITVFTKPGKVSNLTVVENTKTSLLLCWRKPEGMVESFKVTAVNDSNSELYSNELSTSNVTVHHNVPRLPAGSRINIIVTAVVNRTVEGESVTISNYTAPEPVSDLQLVAGHNHIQATWKPPAGGDLSYEVMLQLNDKTVKTIEKSNSKSFQDLKSAANYTVIVRSISGHLKSTPEERSTFTKPKPPLNARLKNTTKNTIAFEWDTPENTADAEYKVSLNSSFWGTEKNFTVNTKTVYEFDTLKSGTRYSFQVRTVAGEMLSDPAKTSGCTVPDTLEVSLSMLCSSTVILHCANETTRDSVFEELQNRFRGHLGDKVFWKLEKQESENAAK